MNWLAKQELHFAKRRDIPPPNRGTGFDVEKMFSVDGCLHRFCFSWMKQHGEAKVLNGMVAKGLRSPQILKEFENLKFFNLGPSSDLMDENWAVTLQLPKKSLLPSKMDEKKNKGKRKKGCTSFLKLFPSKTKKIKKQNIKGKERKTVHPSSTFSCVRPSSTFLKQTWENRVAFVAETTSYSSMWRWQKNLLRFFKESKPQNL